ncbi:MAG: OmpA family protein [Bacteroidales bacterium]|nr:OmpA family protein [Bacteroidales bacterium]
MKKLIVILSAAFALAFSAQAQGVFTPGWNLEVMGGANYVTSNNWNIPHFQHITPNASVSLGYDIAPWFGLRGSLSGPVGTYPIQGKTIGKFGYAQLGVDAMVDICNIFGYNPARFFSPYVFLGGAAGYRFPVEQVKGFFAPGVRAGLGFDFRLTDAIKLALEFQDNAQSNKWNTLDDNEFFGGDILHWKRPFRWDDNFAALLGLKFDLCNGATKAVASAATGTAVAVADAAAAEAAAKAAAARAAAEKAAAEKAAADKAAAEAAAKAAEAEAAAAIAAGENKAQEWTAQENVYFDLNKSVIRPSEVEKITRIVALLQKNPGMTVTIAGYADKATGTHERNMTLSQERSARVRQCLIDSGIAAARISTDYFGDTKQVSTVPENNRVAICLVK